MKVTLHKVFVCTTVIIAVLLCAPHFVSAQSKEYGVKTIVIDPGHGGTDPGCVWLKVYEKDIVLDVALELGAMIKKNMPDVKIVYTRDRDVAVDLYKRGELANKVGADLFVSIHVNSSGYKSGPNPPAGTETYVMGESKKGGTTAANLELIKRENDVMKMEKDYEKNYAGFLSGSAESFVMSSLQQYANTEQSIRFAQTVEKQYGKNTPMSSRKVGQEPFAVLWRTTMPAVLTEIGFINNEKERKFMTSKDGQKKIATSLFNAISEYKAKVEGNSSPLLLGSAGSYGEVPEVQLTSDPRLFPGTSNTKEIAQSGSAPTPAIQNTPDKTINWEFSGTPIVYRIQIHSVPKKLSLNSKELRPFVHNVTERKVGNTYKYYVGNCTTYAEAAELQKEVRKSVKDAFMVAFDGEKQITVSEARKLTN